MDENQSGKREEKAGFFDISCGEMEPGMWTFVLYQVCMVQGFPLIKATFGYPFLVLLQVRLIFCM